jgi:hypothetical protein
MTPTPTNTVRMFLISAPQSVGLGGTCSLPRITTVYSVAPSVIGSGGFNFFTDFALTIPFVGNAFEEYGLEMTTQFGVRVVEINGSGTVTNVNNCY